MRSVFYWSPILDTVTGQFQSSEIEKGVPVFNFGDVLGIEILSKIKRERFAYGPLKTADIFVTGTVGQLIEMHGGAKPGAILAGIGTDPRKDTTVNWPDTYDIRLVRGPLTRAKFRLPDTVPLGDPGLLAREVYGQFEKKFDIGFVRHYKDRTPEPDDVLTAESKSVIEAAQPPSRVCRAIAECRSIVTSSLHGAVVADSYGIPWRRHRAPVGLDLKWEDYRAAVDEYGVTKLKSDIEEALCKV